METELLLPELHCEIGENGVLLRGTWDLSYVGGQRACVYLRQSIFGVNRFEIDHRGLNIAVPHPTLQCADVYALAEMLRGKSVAEFM